MTYKWRIWSRLGPQAYEYLGQADGETFAEACQALAEARPDFRADFEPRAMTHNGNELVPLDRRIDGQEVQFGAPPTRARPAGAAAPRLARDDHHKG